MHDIRMACFDRPISYCAAKPFVAVIEVREPGAVRTGVGGTKTLGPECRVERRDTPFAFCSGEVLRPQILAWGYARRLPS